MVTLAPNSTSETEVWLPERRACGLQCACDSALGPALSVAGKSLHGPTPKYNLFHLWNAEGVNAVAYDWDRMYETVQFISRRTLLQRARSSLSSCHLYTEGRLMRNGGDTDGSS
jgi:hypothetical protein